MKRIPFYRKDPSVVSSIGWLSYGLIPLLAPSILPAAMMSNSKAAGAVAGMIYSILAAALTYPKTRRYVMKGHRFFWDQYRRHRLSKKISVKIRETFLNAGLVVRERRGVKGNNGRVRWKEIVHYPEVEILADEVNFYLQIQMLAGQTEKDWERKLSALAHALRCKLISFQIERGTVELALQHSEIQANAVTYKTDTSHTLTIGYGSGSKLTWDFEHFPHTLIVGPTGTGKSTFVRNLLIQLRREWTVKVADGKQVEFTHLRDSGFDVAIDTTGFLSLVEEAQKEVDRRFKLIQQERHNHYTEIGEEPYFLVVDEAIYLLETLSLKKDKETGESERDRILGLLRDISLRGRAAGVQLVMIFQRPDSSFIPTVIRDNLMAKIVLGGSETALEMAFGKEKSKILDPVSLGNGYACFGDGKVELFRFPDYTQATFLDDLGVQRRDKTNDHHVALRVIRLRKPVRRTNKQESTI